MDNAETDLPDPDSPTRAKVLPLSMLKEMPLTAENEESLE
jgi:hypothetical protein